MFQALCSSAFKKKRIPPTSCFAVVVEYVKLNRCRRSPCEPRDDPEGASSASGVAGGVVGGVAYTVPVAVAGGGAGAVTGAVAGGVALSFTDCDPK